jgi:cyclase
VIACGGAGNVEHVVTAVRLGFADAVALASILHYEAVNRCRYDDDFQAEGNTIFLQSGRTFSRIKPLDLATLKTTLMDRGILSRRIAIPEVANV